MGDVIDFASARGRMPARPERRPEQEGDGTELIYDPKPGSVGVGVSVDEDGVAHFRVVVPAAELAPAIAKARTALLANFGVDPADLAAAAAVRDQLGADSYDAFVTTFVQQHFFAKAMTRTTILPFLTPDYLTDEAPEEGKDYTFRVSTIIRPSYELTSYDPVAVKLPEKRTVSSRDVTDYLDNMSRELATWEEDASKQAVEVGDRVTLNIDATDAAGRDYRPLSGRHIPYLVGSGMIGEEFDRQLAGMKPRERSEFSLSLPAASADGSATYEMVRVKVQVDSIQHQVPAKIDDAWVMQNMPEAQTLLGLRGRVRTMLEREADAAYHDEVAELVADKLAERLVGELDERYVEGMRDELETQYIGDLAARGVSWDQVRARPEFDEAEWEEELTVQARLALRRGLALDSLADHLDIQITEEDIAKVVGKMAPGHEQEALQGLIDSGQMPKMCEVALRTRANDWLVDHVRPLGGTPAPRQASFSGGVVLGGNADGKGPKGPSDPDDRPHLQLV